MDENIEGRYHRAVSEQEEARDISMIAKFKISLYFEVEQGAAKDHDVGTRRVPCPMVGIRRRVNGNTFLSEGPATIPFGDRWRQAHPF